MTEECEKTRGQIDRLIRKVESNHDTIIRLEQLHTRQDKLESQVNKLCNRISSGLRWLLSTLIVILIGLGGAIAQLIMWVQELISRTLIIA